ncbi:uncharacterized protein LOC101848910 [Aplysia californica]|uniref:Uncharacterized protein LOC101848910 n=1 Tax=Aplysia californica TaxID=6500 RepID=A0ABM1A792_APLCA|nr:uncharacterized protein LOC101848910 [Aplysia californica]
MDINGLLEQTWNNPPEPNNFGCARKALIPFFKLMQITGCYHEYRHFQELDKVTREKAKAAHNEDQKKKIQYPLDSPEGACYRRLSKYRQFEQKMITESYNGQGNIRIKAMMKSDENEDVQTCRGDMLYLYTVGVPDGTNQFEESGSYFKRLVDGWRKRTPNPLGHPESFLNRCAMVPSEATKDEVLQLGAKWDPEVGSEVNATTDASRSWFSAVFSDRVFSFLVVCILWANLFRCAIYVGGRETVDTFHVVACGSWYFMSASTCTVMFVTCAKKSYFREFFWKWGTIYTDPVTKQLGLHGVITTGFTKWVIAFQWGAILFNLFAIASIMIFSDYLFTDGMSKIFYITGQRSIPWLIASILVHFFVSCSWLSPTAFIVVMCHHIVQHFEALNMVIKLHVGAAKSRFPQHLALLRERHLAMCETVEVMDRCISKLSIFIYG